MTTIFKDIYKIKRSDLRVSVLNDYILHPILSCRQNPDQKNEYVDRTTACQLLKEYFQQIAEWKTWETQGKILGILNGKLPTEILLIRKKVHYAKMVTQVTAALQPSSRSSSRTGLTKSFYELIIALDLFVRNTPLINPCVFKNLLTQLSQNLMSKWEIKESCSFSIDQSSSLSLP